jgi:microcystin-dependent protein
MATSIQTFAGNVGIGTNDPKTYALNVADGGTTRITTLSATTIQVGLVTNSFVPAGTIGMWGNADVPTGWVLCDGNNGTPNLNGKFIVGAGTGSAYSVEDEGGNSGGAAAFDASNMPAHTHSGTTGNQSANHKHNYTDPGHYHRQKASDDAFHFDNTEAQSSNYYGQLGFNTYGSSHGLSAGNQSANHTHSITTGSAGGNTLVTMLPAYRKVRFIMKT